MGKPRESNFELFRLVSMLMVMVCHANGYVNETDLMGIEGIAKVAVNQLCMVCVNVFVMISGWFGIRPTWKGAGSLLFQVIFLCVLCFGCAALIGLPVSVRKDLIPYLFFGYGYWFVVSYLILYAISPVLNRFCENTNRQEFLFVLATFFLLEFIYGFLLNVGHFDFGFSPLSFIGLYLLSRYARLYPGRFSSMDKWTDLALYFGLSVLSMFGLWFGYRWFGMGFHLNHYDSPLAIMASLFLLLFFSKLHFQSKAVNWLAISAFAIYLLHENSLVSPYYHQLFDGIKSGVSLAVYYPIMLGLVIIIGLCCILVDKLRILAWNAIVRVSGPSTKAS